MRALLIVLSLPLIVAATKEPFKSAPAESGEARALCTPLSTAPIKHDAETRTGSRRLSEMPAAKQQLSVVRTVDGCSMPTVIRDNIGGD